MSVWKTVRVFKVRLESFDEEHGWCGNFDTLNVVAESAEEAIHSAMRIALISETKVRPEEVTILSNEVHCPVEP